MLDISKLDFKTISPNPTDDPLIKKYNDYISRGKGETLKKIYKINSGFNLFLFYDDIFSDKFINVYGYNFLIKYISVLEVSFLEFCINYLPEKLDDSIFVFSSFKFNIKEKLLFEILELNPKLKMYDIKIDIYQSRFIEHYGLDFLAKNNDFLNCNMLNVGFNNMKLLEYLINHQIPISSFLIDSSLTIDKINLIEKLIKDPEKKHYIENMMNLDDIFLLDDNDSWLYISKYLLYFNIEQVTQNIPIIFMLKKIPNILKIIVILKDSNISLSNILLFCSSHLSLIDDIGYSSLNSKQLNNLKNLCKIPSSLNLDINCVEDLDNYKSIKLKGIERYILSKSTINEKTMYFVLDLLFGDKNILERSKSALNILKKNDIYPEYFSYLEDVISLSNCIDKNIFISIIKRIVSSPYSLDDIESCTKKICVFDLCDNLSIFDKTLKVIKLEGQDFKLLVHKISGLSNKIYGIKINNDISMWDVNSRKDIIISTSLIDQYYIGIVPGMGYILGFNNIDEENILDMGPCDIYSEPLNDNKYRGTKKSCFMMTDDLLRNSLNGYNEIVLRRFVKGKDCRPSFVLSQNIVGAGDKQVSSYFNIPIYIINMEKYLIVMQNHLKYLINNLKLDNYKIYLLQSFLSFYSQYDIATKYFNDYELIRESKNIINKINLEMTKNNQQYFAKKLDEIIDTYSRISEMMYSQKISTGINYDKDELKRLIKRK